MNQSNLSASLDEHLHRPNNKKKYPSTTKIFNVIINYQASYNEAHETNYEDSLGCF